MARLFGIIANRPDLSHRFAQYETQALSAKRKEEEQWGWGVGFFQGGEILEQGLKDQLVEHRIILAWNRKE